MNKFYCCKGILRNNYQSRNLIGPHHFWVLSPEIQLHSPDCFLLGGTCGLQHKTGLASFLRPCPAFYHLLIKILLTYDHIKKQSPSKFLAVGACLPYVVTTCTKLCIICDYYLTKTCPTQLHAVYANQPTCTAKLAARQCLPQTDNINFHTNTW